MKKLVWILLLATLACDDDSQINLVEGTLYRDCNTPLPYRELALKSKIEGSFSEVIILGAATTDADGRFQFTYEMGEEEEGLGEMIYVSDQGYTTILDNLILNRDVILNLYLENRSAIQIALSGNRNFSPNDTLYYSITGNGQEFYRIQPANGLIDTIYSQVPARYNGQTSRLFYYGIGLADFSKARQAVGIADSTYQHIPIDLSACGPLQTLSLKLD